MQSKKYFSKELQKWFFFCILSLSIWQYGSAQCENVEVTTIAGMAGIRGSVDATGTTASFSTPTGLSTDIFGNLYVTDFINNTIRKITPSGVVTTLAGLAGTIGTTDGIGTNARFVLPYGLTVDNNGIIYVSEFGSHTIRRITPSGVVTTLAGTSFIPGSMDGIGTSASFDIPTGLITDASGNLFVADFNNHTIRKITPSGIVTTIAGTALISGSTDAIGTIARFNAPYGLAIDGIGNIYVTDSGNHTIRKITPSGIVTTIAGMVGVAGSSDGVGAAALFDRPTGITIDLAGNLYVADSRNHTIRKITPNGVVTTIAGTAGVSGNSNGSGTNASFNLPTELVIDIAGNIYISDSENHIIRKIGNCPIIEAAATIPDFCNCSNILNIEGVDGKFKYFNGILKLMGTPGVSYSITDAAVNTFLDSDGSQIFPLPSGTIPASGNIDIPFYYPPNTTGNIEADIGGIPASVNIQDCSVCPTMSISDSCSCDDELNITLTNGSVTYFHNVLRINGASGSAFTISSTSSVIFLNSDGSEITPLPSGVIPASGSIDIPFFHPPNNSGSITAIIDGTTVTKEVSTCSDCPITIPTFTQWSLLIYSLLVLNIGLIVLYYQKLISFKIMRYKNKN